jgi:anti-sigma-K factor RskA
LQFNKRPSLWKALGLIASGAAAALVAVALLLPLQRAAMPASYVAVLSDPKTNQPVLIATAQRNAMVLHVNTLEPNIHVAGRSLELWALPRGAQPKSLGVLAGARSELKLLAVADRSLGDVPTLAISLEPPGGSPTGTPTEVTFTGAVVPADL